MTDDATHLKICLEYLLNCVEALAENVERLDKRLRFIEKIVVREQNGNREGPSA